MRAQSLLLAFVLNMGYAHAQTLSVDDRQIAESARTKYYNLEARGFQSLKCAVKFDLSTVPLLSQASDNPVRRLIESTNFALVIDGKGRPNVQYAYPSDGDANTEKQAAQVTSLLRSLVGGLFQTWPSKGLNGPIPSFDNQIESITATDHGFTFSLRVPGAPVEVILDKDYLATEIVSTGGKLRERPKYIPTPEGLVFAGNEADDKSNPNGPVAVKYELETSLIEGLRVPTSAHLQVNGNIDVKFAMTGCAVQKATIIQVKPSSSAKKP